MSTLSIGEIIDQISAESKNSANHDIAFAYRIIEAMNSKPQVTNSIKEVAGLGRIMTDDEVVTLQFDSEEAAEYFSSSILPSVDVDAMSGLRKGTQQATPEPLIVKGAMAGMVDAQVRDLWPTKGARPEPVGEPVGEAGTMPGASGFTMACFHAEKVPVGTKLYTRPPPTGAGGADDLARSMG